MPEEAFDHCKAADAIATILSASMMLDWLGERHQDDALTRAAADIDSAVAAVLKQGETKTADIGGRSGTSEVGDAVARALQGKMD